MKREWLGMAVTTGGGGAVARPLALLCALAPSCRREPLPVKTDGAASSAFGGVLPGAGAPSADLVAKLGAAWSSRAPTYLPRTRHVRPDGSPKYTNRLFLESSPYLGQHAHNPVNWFPWGDEAFETARRLGRPVLLSVGYSTCHWCHVMEEESFEDEEIARLMNEKYVAIKVDREERPDVDAIYMAAVQQFGRGGWPMTVWLTPERKPFFGGTYFPPEAFRRLLAEIEQKHREDRAGITRTAQRIAAEIRRDLEPAPGEGLPAARILDEAAKSYRMRFDRDHGGLVGRPKFPSSLPVRFLLRHHRRTGDAESLRMATLTLEKMAEGGMYDLVGGGFHRYSTDERWLVPHFEKMLYDNALLAMAYLEGFQATGRADFARVAREILRYVERDMTSPDGAFYSATDADSPGPGGKREEGWFFTWTPREIEEALGEERAKIVIAHWGVTARGNFEGRNIPRVVRPIEDVARQAGVPLERARAIVEESREALYAARARRPAPLRDEKILAAWNGLMISAFARAARTLGEPRYVGVAARAADFALAWMRPDGRLRRSFKGGRAHHAAYLDDYAFVIAGLIDLYEADGNARWLGEAVKLDAVVGDHYEDRTSGGFFMTADDAEELLAREKPAYDGAEPTGNSVHALDLLRLWEITTDERYHERAVRLFWAFERILSRGATALAEMLLGLDFFLDTPREIAIVTPGAGAAARAEAEPLLARLRRTFLPNHVLVVAAAGADLERQAARVPWLKDKIVRGGHATAYVCEKQICQLPTGDPDVFERQIRRPSAR